MIDDHAKAHLHDHLRWVREALVWKLDGLSEYDIRRPLTPTGTNLLGLVKHNAVSDARYFGEVFDRPFPEPLPRWDDWEAWGTDHWATEHETRAHVLDLYRRVWSHADATIEALDLTDLGFVPWWDEEVPLFNVMVHRLSDSTRHAGHADILREGLDGAVGWMLTVCRCMDVTVPSGTLAARRSSAWPRQRRGRDGGAKPESRRYPPP